MNYWGPGEKASVSFVPIHTRNEFVLWITLQTFLIIMSFNITNRQQRYNYNLETGISESARVPDKQISYFGSHINPTQSTVGSNGEISLRLNDIGQNQQPNLSLWTRRGKKRTYSAGSIRFPFVFVSSPCSTGTCDPQHAHVFTCRPYN